jgi:hypothetical protein
MRAMRRITMVATPLRATVRTNMPLRRRVRGKRHDRSPVDRLADHSGRPVDDPVHDRGFRAGQHAGESAARGESPCRPAHTPPPAPVQASVRAEPVGVWSDGAGAPPLAQWLADQGSDPRLRVTIVVRHGPGDQAAAFARAAALAQSAGERGKNARVVVEPGISRGATVTLGFDTEESASAT